MKIIDDLKTLSGNPSKKQPIQKKGTPKLLLIVEDEKSLAKVLANRFKEEGYQVLVAENGKEGLQLALADDPNIILLDLLMPIMDGKSMLWRLRESPQHRHTPVIVLTNAGEVDNIRQTMTYSSAIDFLIKANVSVDDIVKRVKSVVW